MAKKKAAKKKAAAKGKVPKKKAVKKAVKKKAASPKATVAMKKAAKKKAAKKKGGKKKVKRQPNSAFMKPLQPDEALGAVVGNSPLPRTQVVKKLWVYIRKHKLQDAKNRRMINADDKLRAVFGGKDQVTMFEMTSLVNEHLG